MASGDPVTSSLTAPQKQLPAWDMASSFELLRHCSAGKAEGEEVTLTR
jgi:hypothetical protein